MKRWEKRRFFYRDWEPIEGPAQVGPLKFDYTFSVPACRIYGYEDDSEYDEDHRSIDAAMKRGLVFGRWFSTACPDGEPGTQPMTELKQITREEFEGAEQRRWTALSD